MAGAEGFEPSLTVLETYVDDNLLYVLLNLLQKIEFIVCFVKFFGYIVRIVRFVKCNSSTNITTFFEIVKI